jgi:hypothetical protein
VKSGSDTSVRPPEFIEPMKAKLVDSMPSGDWIYEIKFNGYRALALRGGNETQSYDSRIQGGGGVPPYFNSHFEGANQCSTVASE